MSYDESINVMQSKSMIKEADLKKKENNILETHGIIQARLKDQSTGFILETRFGVDKIGVNALEKEIYLRQDFRKAIRGCN